ncbi:hypothetical protein GCM10022243_21300 [Saccharothrix violaceirubra]|uniref:Uncharacterized protein n=1 Tax=Saccharothrix violaceirubra TaxID=413306 RepID=A0A7W7T8I9_9PSEU|nr:hypothetical protein [Saccharothrix violaceirubra]MBB4968529.1 hypothetical protein [Saccharothrix violaceirubra]
MNPLTGVAQSVLVAVVVGVATVFGINHMGASLFWSVVIAVPVAALALLGARLPRAADVHWAPPPVHHSSATTVQASTLATRLAEAAVDPDRFASRVQPRLRRLVEARLRQRHGVPDLADPRAVALLGPELHRLVTAPDATLPDPKRFAELLEDL